MAINGLTLLSGATNSATGGTTKTYNLDGQAVKNGVHVSDQSVTDFRLRPGITFKSRMPQRKADGSWMKGKFSATIVMPKLLADGKTVEYPLGRIEIEPHAESTDAEVTEIMTLLAQLAFRAPTVPFFKTGSLA